MTAPLLSVENLRVAFDTEDGIVRAVDGISYSLAAGATLAIVGEAGSGKSVAAETALGLPRTPQAKIAGRILFEGRDLLTLPDDELRRIRGNEIAMIFQDPLASMHPLYRVGSQIAQAVRAHRDVSKAAARDRSIDLLDRIGIPDSHRCVDRYPHELSGAMRQRVMIAMALANEPKLLIADEPTRALDVTEQAQILALLGDLRRRLGIAIVIVTHDLGVAAEIAEEIAVMYAGRIVEHGSAQRIFTRPQHPCTWGLLKPIPRLEHPPGEELELVPISGRPPSLINRPTGCHFHPRCPYAADAHRWIDPKLDPVPDQPGHEVACLLDPAVRTQIWRGLQDGQAPASLRQLAQPGLNAAQHRSIAVGEGGRE